MEQKNKRIILSGKKIGMTQMYDQSGALSPVTVICLENSQIVQVKNQQKDGYEAIQLGTSINKASRLTKAELGHLKKAQAPAYSHLHEVRVTDSSQFALGQTLGLEQFAVGTMVDVIGTTVGRGFQGVVKRHGFKGGPATHGHMAHNRPGAIGCRADPGRVNKGQKMPGHMGAARRTVQNLYVLGVIPEKNFLLVKGSVPGSRGARVLVRGAKKAKNSSAV